MKLLIAILGFVIITSGCLGQSYSDTIGEQNETDNETETPNNTNETENAIQNTTEPTETIYESYTIEGDDGGMYNEEGDEIDSLGMREGAEVTIIFIVREENVYFGGLDFRSSKFDSPVLHEGENWTTTLIADEEFTINSYWPATNVKKGSIRVSLV